MKITIICIVSIVVTSLFLMGCIASEPRFRSKVLKPSSGYQPTKDNRFSINNDSLETIEDDVKVDVSGLQSKIVNTPNISDSKDNFHDKLLTEVLSLIGRPYSYGGKKDSSLDCSMFSCQIFEKSYGIKLPRSTDEQFRIGKEILNNNLESGDLVFFNTTGKIPSHVGIYIGNNLFAHASRLKGVTISSMESTYYKRRYVGARRVRED